MLFEAATEKLLLPDSALRGLGLLEVSEVQNRLFVIGTKYPSGFSGRFLINAASAKTVKDLLANAGIELDENYVYARPDTLRGKVISLSMLPIQPPISRIAVRVHPSLARITNIELSTTNYRLGISNIKASIPGRKLGNSMNELELIALLAFSIPID